MKDLTIEHRDKTWNLKYKIFSDADEYNGHYYFTEFYLGEETRTYRKYWLWGDYITETNPKMVFKLYNNIESIDYTKDQIRGKIIHHLDLLVRAEEIANGEIV